MLWGLLLQQTLSWMFYILLTVQHYFEICWNMDLTSRIFAPLDIRTCFEALWNCAICRQLYFEERNHLKVNLKISSVSGNFSSLRIHFFTTSLILWAITWPVVCSAATVMPSKLTNLHDKLVLHAASNLYSKRLYLFVMFTHFLFFQFCAMWRQCSVRPW